MQRIETKQKMWNAIGGEQQLKPGKGVLSLVRNFKPLDNRHNPAHAYLILERMDSEGRYLVDEAHLYRKRGTEDWAHPRGYVVHKKYPQPEQQEDDVYSDIMRLDQHSYAYSWPMDAEKIAKFEQLLASEKKRSEYDEILYFKPGYAKTAGLFGASLQNSRSEVIQEWSIIHSKNNSASEYLLRKGHNCYSWAQAIIMNLSLEPPAHFIELIFKDPRKTLKADDKRCLLM